MVKYLLTGMAGAAVLAAFTAGQAADLSMTPIYQGRPAAGSAGASAPVWALAERWTIRMSVAAGAPLPQPGSAAGSAQHPTAWSTGAGYTMLARWGLNGDYGYVDLLDSGTLAAPARPATTTLTKTNAKAGGRSLKVGANYGF
jgi:hypothetical protein